MKVDVLCTLEAGLWIFSRLATELPIRSVIGLTDRPAADSISGFKYMEPYARRAGVEFVGVESYGLTDAADREKLLARDIELLLVIGWQRLVPKWLIEHAKVGVIGGHGSPGGIHAGRGRSPQNWALMLGARQFSMSIFFIDEGIDTGNVIDTRVFAYEPEDDIQSSQCKVAMSTADMIIDAYRSGRIARREAIPQPTEAFYLPQRQPADGEIDWHRSTQDIVRFVRALSAPYPGAFAFLEDGRRVTIWKARPFTLEKAKEAKPTVPGQILMNLGGRALVVATLNGMILVDEFSVDPAGHEDAIAVGSTLRSTAFREQLERIVKRHQEKYPNLPVSSALTDLLTPS